MGELRPPVPGQVAPIHPLVRYSRLISSADCHFNPEGTPLTMLSFFPPQLFPVP